MTPNCPFYGRHLAINRQAQVLVFPFALADSGGNQCALVMNAFSPCQMEFEGLPVEWTRCPRVRAIRLED